MATETSDLQAPASSKRTKGKSSLRKAIKAALHRLLPTCIAGKHKRPIERSALSADSLADVQLRPLRIEDSYSSGSFSQELEDLQDEYCDARSAVSCFSAGECSPRSSFDLDSPIKGKGEPCKEQLGPLPAGALLHGHLPSWVPSDPLPFLDPLTQYIPMPESTGFSGYWTKVPNESDGPPMPIDVMLSSNYLACKAHNSVKAVEITETPDTVVFNVPFAVFGIKHTHVEEYQKDGSISMGRMRRDCEPGRMELRGFYTEQRQLVFVVQCFRLGGMEPEYTGVDVFRLIDGGEKVQCQQNCIQWCDRKTASQRMVGQKSKK